MSYLDNINSPADLKKLDINGLKNVAEEIRQAILNRDSKVGGHVGPNLGIVETTIAMHYVFNSPADKFVFDVSHQCYPHKILTGRKDGFLTDEGMQRISGYTNPAESEHDNFVVGHTSTSVSLASGLAKARDLKGEKYNVVAVIGDGSLSGGEALEGLDNAAVLNSNIIVVVNDNEMSIAENHGGLYDNLRLLRKTNGEAQCNLFKALGFDYHYLENGNDIEELLSLFRQVKDTNLPTLLHIHTEKGKGYAPAEQNKEAWHWSVPFDIKTGKPTLDFGGENYNSLTVNYLQDKIANDKKVVLVNAGTPGAIGMSPEMRAKFGANFVDVGIAEEHAVAMSSGLAKGGCKPIFWVLSSFVQRTYDQLSQDLALNNNPAVILVGWNGINSADATHLGCFDIPLISNIPNIVYLAPTTKEEYFSMLDWGIEQNKHPVVIRIPAVLISREDTITNDYSDLNKFVMLQQGSKVAIIAAGSMRELGEKTVALLAPKGINATLINPRYLSGLDAQMLNRLKDNHDVIVTLEDGELDGGFGEKIARFYGDSNMKVISYGAKKEFNDREPMDKLIKRYRLREDLIVEDTLKLL